MIMKTMIEAVRSIPGTYMVHTRDVFGVNTRSMSLVFLHHHFPTYIQLELSIEKTYGNNENSQQFSIFFSYCLLGETASYDNDYLCDIDMDHTNPCENLMVELQDYLDQVRSEIGPHIQSDMRARVDMEADYIEDDAESQVYEEQISDVLHGVWVTYQEDTTDFYNMLDERMAKDLRDLETDNGQRNNEMRHLHPFAFRTSYHNRVQWMMVYGMKWDGSMMPSFDLQQPFPMIIQPRRDARNGLVDMEASWVYMYRHHVEVAGPSGYQARVGAVYDIYTDASRTSPNLSFTPLFDVQVTDCKSVFEVGNQDVIQDVTEYKGTFPGTVGIWVRGNHLIPVIHVSDLDGYILYQDATSVQLHPLPVELYQEYLQHRQQKQEDSVYL